MATSESAQVAPISPFPRLHLEQDVTRFCPQLLRTLQELLRDPNPKKPEHSPARVEDHLPDVTRHILGKSFEPRISTSRRQLF